MDPPTLILLIKEDLGSGSRLSILVDRYNIHQMSRHEPILRSTNPTHAHRRRYIIQNAAKTPPLPKNAYHPCRLAPFIHAFRP